MITLDISMEDLVQEFPQTVPLLVRWGVVCIQCGEPVWGTLGEAMDRSQVADKDALLRELNEAVAHFA
ncbi:MAG: DUF1858 domain-containing protein [Candidatus Zixiibacteriota bacterium]|nr:MAG: DUF1858 domain-containing protein [candidate division Zixibacteria bacterium]